MVVWFYQAGLYLCIFQLLVLTISMKKVITVLAFAAISVATFYSCKKSGTTGIMQLPRLPEMPFNYSRFNFPTSFSPNNLGLRKNSGMFDDMMTKGGSGSYGELIQTKSPDPANSKPLIDTTIQGDYKATLGRVLFYDRNLSLTSTVACGSCHKQSLGFSDDVAFSNGFKNLVTARNSMPISNVLLRFNQQGLFWDMREMEAEKMVLMPVSNHIEMGFTEIDKIVTRLNNIGYYPKMFKDAFGDEAITKDRISQALAQFLNSMVSFNSKFDKGREVAFSNFNAQELAGKDLFFNTLNCGSCHEGSNVWGEANRIANIGLDLKYADKGITTQTVTTFNDFGMPQVKVLTNMEGLFKIPSLRNIALTAPYMHDGRFTTLEQVIDHYDHGVKAHPDLDPKLKNSQGQPQRLNLTPEEKKQLIAFLNTMTDTQFINDPKFSDPFNQ